jgi:hypothetical protein
MAWTFEITTGKLYDPLGNVAAEGYSGGNRGQNPEGVDNPADEPLKNIGPIPEGEYSFGDPVLHSQLGPFAIPLNPASSNQMFGREGFFCHGDNSAHAASEGCIIMPPDIRKRMWASPDHDLQVVAVKAAAAA